LIFRLAKYGDEDAILIALGAYENAGEYSKILALTESIDMTSCKNDIARIRLGALFKRNNRQFEDEAYAWYTSRPMTLSMNRLYQETVTESLQSAKSKIINFRIDVYNANYNSAYERFSEIRETVIKNGTLPLTAQIVSDMGKACLYGSSSYIKNAKIFTEIAAKEKSDKDIVYNAYFYAGRLYDKADSDYAAAESCFVRAMNTAQSGIRYDNALWYLLNGSLRTSVDTAMGLFKTYRANIDNPSYFDDFFELIVPLLLSQSRWSDFKKVYEAVDGYASDVSVGRFAYLYGRLVQEGLIASAAPRDEAENAFRRVLSLNCDTYYKTLAAVKLGLDDEAAKVMADAIITLHSVCIEHDFLDSARWKKTLFEISSRDDLNTRLSGLSAAILLEMGSMDKEELGIEVERRLSKGIPAELGASWFEGLAMKNRYALIARLSLWEKLSSYLDTLDDDEFKRSLVFLRRAFADFSSEEKYKIAENLGEIWDINPVRTAETLNSMLKPKELEDISGLDDFDFGDI